MAKTYFYNVPDCEHDGDIRDAENEVEEAGGKVVDTYWDGEDCGEAYVEYSVPDGTDPDEVYRRLHRSRGFYGRCASVARRIVAASGRNVFDDYFTFYQDGKWLVEVVRKLKATVSRIGEKPSNAVMLMPKVEENLGYLKDVDLEEMSVSSANDAIKPMAERLRDAVNNGGDVADAANELHKYLESYEKSCRDVMRNRYSDDERDVSGLLDTIRESGNYVINGR